MRDSAIARFTATVVFPTPPFPEPTAIRFLTPGMGVLGGMPGWLGVIATIVAIVTGRTSVAIQLVHQGAFAAADTHRQGSRRDPADFVRRLPAAEPAKPEDLRQECRF